MSEDRRETIVWDNIPEWALYALEYGMDEDLFITDEDRKFPQRLCHVGGLGIVQRVRPLSGIRQSLQDLQGHFCNGTITENETVWQRKDS